MSFIRTNLVYILSMFVLLTSCQPTKAEDDAINDLIFHTIEKSLPNKEPGCDSLRFPDFQNNLKEIELKINRDFVFQIERIAEKFVEEQCKTDTLYCGEIYLKHRKYYISPSGHELFAFGYAFKDRQDETEESASFFVFGVKKDEKLLFHDIVEDLMGNIQLTLSGLEMYGKQMIIWGEMYPYFPVNGYGKFKLTSNGERIGYDYECIPD